MKFLDIEAHRKAAGITVARLTRTAGMPHSTYYRLQRGRRGGMHSTTDRLEAALRAILEREAHERRHDHRHSPQAAEPARERDADADLLWRDGQLQQI
jgi:transcriptional regulator with XRE-family HTH domain